VKPGRVLEERRRRLGELPAGGKEAESVAKFWSEEGVEAVMQLRADHLSDDEPMEHFWRRRADRMTGQRTYARRSA
jgi:hypothetical protein